MLMLLIRFVRIVGNNLHEVSHVYSVGHAGTDLPWARLSNICISAQSNVGPSCLPFPRIQVAGFVEKESVRLTEGLVAVTDIRSHFQL
jgi:hypothetical protein